MHKTSAAAGCLCFTWSGTDPVLSRTERKRSYENYRKEVTLDLGKEGLHRYRLLCTVPVMIENLEVATCTGMR
jgi:hypothetical protein